LLNWLLAALHLFKCLLQLQHSPQKVQLRVALSAWLPLLLLCALLLLLR
jgi:hypothetical protein